MCSGGQPPPWIHGLETVQAGKKSWNTEVIPWESASYEKEV